MATYKVLQDVEAEDKILGPLTLRQFIYGLVTVFFLYLCFIVLAKGAPYLLVIFLPPALFTGFFTFPFGRDQPTEVWALAKIRFLFKPRKRLWDQSGVKELVTITVPKKIEQFLTNGLSPNEVESRLKTLADTIDSRGWAIKNVNVNLYTQTGLMATTSSDRLIDINNMPREVPNYDIEAADDILDEKNNPLAHQFENMINASTASHRKKLVDELNTIIDKQVTQPPATPNDYWFLNQPSIPQELKDSQAMFTQAQIIHPGAVVDVSGNTVSAADATLDAQLKAQSDSQQGSYAHLRTIQPLANNTGSPMSSPTVSLDHKQAAPIQALAPSPTAYDPAIISLANNNDLNVATLARQAYKAKNPDDSQGDEVVISLR